MKDVSKIAVIIQGRLNSTRVPNKMVEPIFRYKGILHSLMDIAIKKTIKAVGDRSRIFVAAHEEELTRYAGKYAVNLLKRSEASAMEENDVSLIYEWSPYLESLGFEHVILINACLLFLQPSTIKNFIDHYVENDDTNGLFGVVAKKNYFWEERDGKIVMVSPWPDDAKIMNTKNVPVTYEAAHALYASPLHIIKDGYWMDNSRPPNPSVFVMQENLELFDIDHPWQMQVAKALAENGFDTGIRRYDE